MLKEIENLAEDAFKCQECGEPTACWAICSDIVKRYPLDVDGDVVWSEEVLVWNFNDPVLMCADCASVYLD